MKSIFTCISQTKECPVNRIENELSNTSYVALTTDCLPDFKCTLHFGLGDDQLCVTNTPFTVYGDKAVIYVEHYIDLGYIVFNTGIFNVTFCVWEILYRFSPALPKMQAFIQN